MQMIFGAIFTILGSIGALFVILKREPMQGALFLVLTLFSVAASYVLLGAEFLAAVQVIIYAGAIMVLIVFVIQLIGTKSLPVRMLQKQTPLAVGAAALIFIQTSLITLKGLRSFHITQAIESPAESTLSFSKSLFTQFIFPFEVTSVLLLVAIIGTVILAQKKDVRE